MNQFQLTQVRAPAESIQGKRLAQAKGSTVVGMYGSKLTYDQRLWNEKVEAEKKEKKSNNLLKRIL